jgi:hypothetical protein
MHSRFCVFLLFGLLTVGCGGSESSNKSGLDLGSQEANAIGTLLDDFADMGSNPKKAEQLFVKGSKPADLKPFAKYSYSLVGKPSVSGSTGTCKIRIDVLKSGEKVGEQEWTFEKDGDKWQVKSAPLP